MTDHFSLRELTHSLTAERSVIDNTPPDAVIQSLHFTAAGLERIRALLSHPLYIRSGYRCQELNQLVGGSKNSQHMKGEAADFTCIDFGSPRNVAKYLERHVMILGIDQLIYEGTWVHVSFTLNPRYEVLTLQDRKYVRGIVGV